MTIQCMNPEALQTTNGIVYAGVMPVVPKVLGDIRTWDNLAASFVAFGRPRLCAAAKLALTGVEVSLVPMNMSALADFTELKDVVGAPTIGTWQNYTGNALEPMGFAPLFVYNPNEIALQFLVTVEYRMRFDIAHPASSTHVFHTPGSMETWHSVVKGMTELGHGVKDIAAVVADAGMAVGSVALHAA
jgi:sorbitol-specific phosphotransferase system component IIC